MHTRWPVYNRWWRQLRRHLSAQSIFFGTFHRFNSRNTYGCIQFHELVIFLPSTLPLPRLICDDTHGGGATKVVHKDGRFLNSSPHLGLFNGGLGGGKRILEREASVCHFAWLQGRGKWQMFSKRSTEIIRYKLYGISCKLEICIIFKLW